MYKNNSFLNIFGFNKYFFFNNNVSKRVAFKILPLETIVLFYLLNTSLDFCIFFKVIIMDTYLDFKQEVQQRN